MAGARKGTKVPTVLTATDGTHAVELTIHHEDEPWLVGDGRERMPELILGGFGERYFIQIAARYADIWNNESYRHRRLARKIEVLRRCCDEFQRDPDSIQTS